MATRMTLDQPTVVVSRAAAWTAAGATDRGRVRRANEDCFMMHAEAGAFVVCDGMGGAAAGETASHVAAETALDLLARSLPGPEAVHGAMRQANSAVHERSLRDRRLEGMGTTMVALILSPRTAAPKIADPGTAWVGHVGDSRCYRWRAGVLERLTADHSVVEEQIQMRRMTREQARHSPMQHMITRAVGTRAKMEADVRELAIAPDDLYLLATDGLTRELTDAMIGRVLRECDGDPAAACATLVAAANAAGGRDNITCVLVRVNAD